MPLTLSGTNGVSGVDGSASTPANRGSDTNTGIVYGTDTVQIATGGTTAVTVDSSQRVGIGTASPSQKLHLYGGAFLIDNGTSAGTIYLADLNNYINLSSSTMQFAVNGAERARIDSSGNLLVGTTTATTTIGGGTSNTTSNKGWLAYNGTDGVVLTAATNNQGVIFSSGAFRVFNASGAGVYLTSGNTSWTGTSDERLKNIVSEISNATDKVNTLRAINFTWKSDTQNTPHVGLIAQDVQAVLPEAVTELDGHLGVQYTDVIPLLVGSIKELSAKLDAAEARIAALEAN